MTPEFYMIILAMMLYNLFTSYYIAKEDGDRTTEAITLMAPLVIIVILIGVINFL